MAALFLLAQPAEAFAQSISSTDMIRVDLQAELVKISRTRHVAQMLHTRAYLERVSCLSRSCRKCEARQYQRFLKQFFVHELAGRLIAVFQHLIGYPQTLRQRFSCNEFGAELLCRFLRRFEYFSSLVEKGADLRVRMMASRSQCAR